jgi:hypothetical protein
LIFGGWFARGLDAALARRPVGKNAPAALARLWKTPRPTRPGSLFFLLFSLADQGFIK